MMNVNSEVLSNINLQIMSCKECGDDIKGGGYIHVLTDKIEESTPRLMIVAQNPGSSNTEQKDTIIPFQINKKTNYNRFFYDLFEGFNGLVYFTNIVKCVTKNNALPSEDQINKCFEKFLIVERNWFKPYLILMFGKACMMKYSTRAYDNLGRTLFLYHPGYLNRNKAEYIKTLNFTRSYMNLSSKEC